MTHKQREAIEVAINGLKSAGLWAYADMLKEAFQVTAEEFDHAQNQHRQQEAQIAWGVTQDEFTLAKRISRLSERAREGLKLILDGLDGGEQR